MNTYKIGFKECIEPCKMILGEVQVDEVNTTVLTERIVRDIQNFVKVIQVQVV